MRSGEIKKFVKGGIASERLNYNVKTIWIIIILFLDICVAACESYPIAARSHPSDVLLT